MNIFDLHSQDTAPTESASQLVDIKKAYGFIPNLYGVFAESPATLKAYISIGKIFDESSFSATERQLIILAISRLNECSYCVAAHSVVAGMQKVPDDIIDAIRNDQPIADSKLEALRVFAVTVVEKRGWVAESDVITFLAAGYTKAQILEVVLGITFKTLSNYTNHMADTPLDDAFESMAWAPEPIAASETFLAP
jgi:uncharacterized peroxidase-related enzyme